jgi:hypothetical protein
MVPESSELRIRQILAGAVLLLVVTLAVCGLLIGWRYVPGIPGEWVGRMIGLATTPFLMEASFVILGFCIVFWLNHRHSIAEGDEWVMLEPGEIDVAEACRVEDGVEDHHAIQRNNESP